MDGEEKQSIVVVEIGVIVEIGVVVEIGIVMDEWVGSWTWDQTGNAVRSLRVECQWWPRGCTRAGGEWVGERVKIGRTVSLRRQGEF